MRQPYQIPTKITEKRAGDLVCGALSARSYPCNSQEWSELRGLPIGKSSIELKFF